MREGVHRAQKKLGGSTRQIALKRKRPTTSTLVAKRPCRRKHHNKDIFD